MRRRVCLLLGLTGPLVLAALAAGGAAAAPAGPAHPPRSASSPRSGSSRLRPRAFASCPGLTAYARRHLAATHGLPEPPVTPLAQPGLAPAPLGASGVAAPVTAGPTDGGSGSAVTFSTTNNQEQGVDEPDIVKTTVAELLSDPLDRLELRHFRTRINNYYKGDVVAVLTILDHVATHQTVKARTAK